jgi:hypothetical protein
LIKIGLSQVLFTSLRNSFFFGNGKFLLCIK